MQMGACLCSVRCARAKEGGISYENVDGWYRKSKHLPMQRTVTWGRHVSLAEENDGQGMHAELHYGTYSCDPASPRSLHR